VLPLETTSKHLN